MSKDELMEIVGRGEDSRHQFKVDVTNPDSLASEVVAFLNANGGTLFIGVDVQDLRNRRYKYIRRH